MATAEELKTLAIQEKNDVWKWFYLHHKGRLHSSLRRLQKHELNALLLLSIEKPVELCRILKKPFFELERIINNPSYMFFTIPKKRGGYREIFAPNTDLKKIQSHLNYFLQAYYLCVKPNNIYGFVINPHYLGKQCNIVSNANLHVGKRFVLNIDLQDFFPSITVRQVFDIFKSTYFSFNEQISYALTLLTTFQGKLPIGAPTSPVISNFVCHQLDSDLISFCENHNLIYSRYADDLTFSSNNPFSEVILSGITHRISSNHFNINTKKTRITTSNRKQTVTGIIVNDKVNVDRKLIRNIRAMLNDLKMNGIETATRNHFSIQGSVQTEMREYFLNRLMGYINFVGQVRGNEDYLYQKFRNSIKATHNE